MHDRMLSHHDQAFDNREEPLVRIMVEATKHHEALDTSRRIVH